MIDPRGNALPVMKDGSAPPPTVRTMAPAARKIARDHVKKGGVLGPDGTPIKVPKVDPAPIQSMAGSVIAQLGMFPATFNHELVRTYDDVKTNNTRLTVGQMRTLRALAMVGRWQDEARHFIADAEKSAMDKTEGDVLDVGVEEEFKDIVDRYARLTPGGDADGQEQVHEGDETTEAKGEEAET
jgi:hypothetical protein